METRAGYLLIGSFVLLTLVGALFFIIWLAQLGGGREATYYDIDFEQSVAGLVVGGDVRYRGIKVGSVTDIGINPDDPQRAHVTIELAATPIRVGDVASLEMQGITGVLYVNIKGADRDSPPVEALPGRERPVIPSAPSALESIFEDAPDLLTAANQVLANLSALMSEENRLLINEILTNVSGLTQATAERTEQLDRILDTFDRSSSEIESTILTWRSTMEQTESLMANDVPALVEEYRQVAVDLRAFIGGAEEIMAENREPLREFTGSQLGEMSNLLVEARQLLVQLRQLTERIDSEGARFLLGPEVSELEVRR